MDWLLFAQTENLLPQTAGGWAGWAGFLSSGGVLLWLLFKHLPAQDARLERFITVKDDQLKSKDELIHTATAATNARIEAVTAIYRQESKEAREEFKNALNAILNHCEKETTKIAEAVRREIELLHARGGQER